MSHSSTELQWMLIGGLVAFAVASVMAIVGISHLTGFTFWEVADNARPILIGPVLFVCIALIEKFEVPLPVRIENTWPIILGFVWIGVHTLIVMAAEKEGVAGVFSYPEAYPEDWVELPWYAGSACRWVVFAAVVGCGYWLRNKRNRDYWR